MHHNTCTSYNVRILNFIYRFVCTILEFGEHLFFKAPTPITGQLLSTYQEISNVTSLIAQVGTTFSREIFCIIKYIQLIMYNFLRLKSFYFGLLFRGGEVLKTQSCLVTCDNTYT